MADLRFEKKTLDGATWTLEFSYGDKQFRGEIRNNYVGPAAGTWPAGAAALFSEWCDDEEELIDQLKSALPK